MAELRYHFMRWGVLRSEPIASREDAVRRAVYDIEENLAAPVRVTNASGATVIEWRFDGGEYVTNAYQDTYPMTPTTMSDLRTEARRRLRTAEQEARDALATLVGCVLFYGDQQLADDMTALVEHYHVVSRRIHKLTTPADDE